MRRAAFLASVLALALAACSSPEARTAALKDHEADGKIRSHEKPYVGHLDSLDKCYFPSGTFEPGREVVLAPIHSGIHATLCFFACRGTIAPHIRKAHEVTLFVVSGSGTVLLPGGKTLPIEAGFMVRVPPGVCHGITANPTDPLKGIVVFAPALEDVDYEAATEDKPGILGAVWCKDVTSPALLPPLATLPDSQKTWRAIDETKFSAVRVSAVRRDRIPDHIHRTHDETVVIFAQTGYGFQRLDEVVDPVQSGQVIHIPAGTVHSFEHQAEGHTRAISIFTPGYDGTDVVKVEQTEDAKAPAGYHRTDRQGDFLQPGQHSDGDFLKPTGPDRIDIRGEDKPPR
jgi:quercetin dioxygenase-like cupin family protein